VDKAQRVHHPYRGNKMRLPFSLSNVTAGFLTVLIGVTSSIVLIFQAATAAGATPLQMSSWIFALGIGMAVAGIGLSLYYRIPILVAWSTPGAALLITSLMGVSLPEAIGAFVFSSVLIILSGMTGFFEKVMTYIPRSLSSAMLAGILLHFGMNIFVAMQHQFVFIFILFIAYLIGKQLFPRFVILFLLLLGMLIAYENGLLHLENLHFVLTTPVFTMPVFSLSVLVSVGVPLFIVTMTSQNIPGIAMLQSSGYQVPINSMMSWIGIVNLLIAPFGGFTLNLAAISAAVCLGADADPDPKKRYKAAIFAGIFYLLLGLFGATMVALFSALPKELVLAVAGFALLGIIGASMKTALEHDEQRESALITLLVSASGITLFDMNSVFWGLIAGIMTMVVTKFYAKRARAMKLIFSKMNFSLVREESDVE